MDRGAWWATVLQVTKESGHDLATKQQPALGRGLDWMSGFDKHVLGTSCVLGAAGTEVKDDGGLVLH